jgi:hypothetical protein
MVAFFFGWVLGGAIHLLPVIALFVFPWRRLPPPLSE